MLKRTKLLERAKIVAKCKELYKQGYTMREVATKVERSIMWVCNAINNKYD